MIKEDVNQFINKEFDVVLENFRKVDELLTHYERYDRFPDNFMYMVDDEPIIQICCEYLSHTLNQYFKKRELLTKELNDTDKN